MKIISLTPGLRSFIEIILLIGLIFIILFIKKYREAKLVISTFLNKDRNMSNI